MVNHQNQGKFLLTWKILPVFGMQCHSSLINAIYALSSGTSRLHLINKNHQIPILLNSNKRNTKISNILFTSISIKGDSILLSRKKLWSPLQPHYHAVPEWIFPHKMPRPWNNPILNTQRGKKKNIGSKNSAKKFYYNESVEN